MPVVTIQKAIFLYFVCDIPFLNFMKENPKEITWVVAKFEKTTKHDQNQQIFFLTLTKKFSVPDYRYMLYKFTQYT